MQIVKVSLCDDRITENDRCVVKIIGKHCQGVNLDVTPFDGKAKDFKNWMKAVEKHTRLNQLNEDQTKLVAYQTTRGAVSDYLDRALNEYPAYEWKQIKSELLSRVA